MAPSPRSEAQRAASRANGRKSSGPRTSAGKGRSRGNAVKHGLRAASLDVLTADAEAPSLILANAVQARLAPEDVIEAELVRGIALAFWRLRRARDLEEVLIEGRQPAANPDGLTRFLLRRANAAEALGLLLRYRNQALGEISRLRRLLEQHRQPAPATAAEVERQSPAARSSARVRPANDNGHDQTGPAPTSSGDR